jgi:hypothetical protein
MGKDMKSKRSCREVRMNDILNGMMTVRNSVDTDAYIHNNR